MFGGTTKAVVALSGGQDSTTCLYWALRRFDRVEAVSFDYGQRHAVELNLARANAERVEVPHTVLHVAALGELEGASLTNPGIESRLEASGTGNDYAAARGLPSSFVPGRNIILLGLAAAYGLPRGAETLVTGVCAEDRAGYPDCRTEFVATLQTTIQVGMDAPEFEIAAPLLRATKAETWQLAEKLDCLDVIIESTHTCYEGDRSQRHAWGYGCGECPACVVRAEGYRDAELLGVG